MPQPTATAELARFAQGIAAQVTQMHPLAGAITDPVTKSEVFKALFEITKQVEVVKKHLLKLEKRDDSTAL
jgi:hypothetical protein